MSWQSRVLSQVKSSQVQPGSEVVVSRGTSFRSSTTTLLIWVASFQSVQKAPTIVKYIQITSQISESIDLCTFRSLSKAIPDRTLTGMQSTRAGFVATLVPSCRAGISGTTSKEKQNRRNAGSSMLRKVTFEVGRAVRETGQALDRLGLRVLGDNAFSERCTSVRLAIFLTVERSVFAPPVVCTHTLTSSFSLSL